MVETHIPPAYIFQVGDSSLHPSRLRREIEPFGHEIVQTATTLAQAFLAIDHELASHVNLGIIRDHLPDGEGIEVMQYLRRSGSTFPIIALTSEGARWGDYNINPDDGIENVVQAVNIAMLVSASEWGRKEQNRIRKGSAGKKRDRKK